nr:hypothetical protein [uncultured Rhodopila sp.]
MMPSYVALTTLTDRIRMDELACVAAALQTQVLRDFAPHWAASAVIAAVPFEAIPAGYCPVIVQDPLETEGASGFHRTEDEEAPYILVPHGPVWSLAASHTILRMLADPAGSGRCAGVSHMPGQGTVEYFIDVVAPCQDIASAYAIDGIVVSDFCIPAFFGCPAARCGSYSFNGTVSEALSPAAGGLVTWTADDRLLYQASADQSGRISLHGGFSLANRGQLTVRELVELLTPDRLERLSHARPTAALITAQQNARRAHVANKARYRDEIGWRFGNATRPRRELAFGFNAANPLNVSLAGYATDMARSGQKRANGDLHTTARTDS